MPVTEMARDSANPSPLTASRDDFPILQRHVASGAPLALILGDDEVEAQQLSIKFLREQREQMTLAWDEVEDWLEGWLQEQAA